MKIMRRRKCSTN